MVLLVMIRQYEGKSYSMFVDWLVEAYYLRISLRLSYILPHYTTLQKFTKRKNKWYYIGQDNFLVYIVTDLYQQTIHIPVNKSLLTTIDIFQLKILVKC